MKNVIKAVLLTAVGVGVLAATTALGIAVSKEISDSDAQHVHSYGEWEVTKEATCTEAGEKKHTCKRDGNVEVEEIAPLGHDNTSYEGKAATCEEGGWEAYTICARCGYSTYQAIAPLGHDYDEWTVTAEASCTQVGQKEKVCSHDGKHTIQETIEKTAHTPSDWIVDKAATCEEKGAKHTACTDCGEVLEVAEIPATGHSAGEWTVDKAATCEETGIRSKKCTTCGKTLEKETIAAIGHSYGEWKVTKEATCTEEGALQQVCTNDSTHVVSVTIKKTAHPSSDWIIDKEVTCEADGHRYKKCTACGITLEEEDIKSVGHQYKDDLNDGRTCTVDGYVNASQGLEMTLKGTGDDQYYSVSGMGTCTDTYVIIPATYEGKAVKAIEQNAFAGCDKITKVYIPETVTAIGSSSFSGCSALETITLPFVGINQKTLDSNYQWAFGSIFGVTEYAGGVAVQQEYHLTLNAVSNKTYYIPASLKSVTILGGDIVYGAFSNCTMLKEVILGDGVGAIGERAFIGCSSLEKVVLGNGVTSIGDSAFIGLTALKEVTFGNKVETIGESAFESCTALYSARRGRNRHDGVQRLLFGMDRFGKQACGRRQCLCKQQLDGDLLRLLQSRVGKCKRQPCRDLKTRYQILLLRYQTDGRG
jgi:hypothetical protein